MKSIVQEREDDGKKELVLFKRITFVNHIMIAGCWLVLVMGERKRMDGMEVFIGSRLEVRGRYG